MNRKKELLYLVFIASALFLFSCAKSSSQTAHQASGIEEHINSFVQPLIDSSKIAGTTIGIVKGDQVLFLKSYGYTDLETKTALSNNAIFEIASVTKPFTAIAILQLADRGLLGLDQDIRKYIQYDSKDRVVTVRQLLNHTSGIKDYTRSTIPGRLEGIEYAKDTVIRMLEKEPFEFEPGTAMSYNNSGYFMLGLIIEKVTGLSYEEYLKQHVFLPSELNSTCDCASIVGEPNKLAAGYNITKDGTLIRVEPGDFKMASAAGSLCSTTGDLLKWSNVLHHSDKLLSKDKYHDMVSSSKLANGTELRYGLGLQINNYRGNKVISHHGVIEGFLSDVSYFPEYDLTVVTLINTLGPVKPKDVSNAIADYYIEEKETEEVFAGNLSPLVGAYAGKVMGRELTRSFEADSGKLFINIAGEKQPLTYVGNNTWRSEDDYTYTFTQDHDTRVQISAPLMSLTFVKEE